MVLKRGFGTDLGIWWEFGGNLVGIWWEFLALIFNELRLFLGSSWEFRGNFVGIWWEFLGNFKDGFMRSFKKK